MDSFITELGTCGNERDDKFTLKYKLTLEIYLILYVVFKIT